MKTLDEFQNGMLHKRAIKFIIQDVSLDFSAVLTKTIWNLDSMKPGYSAAAITDSMKHIEHLTGGGFVVLSGVPGNGKTTAAAILAMNYYSRTQINHRFKQEVYQKYFTARSLAGKKIDAGFSTIGFLHYCAREDRKKEQVNEFGYYYDFRYPETNFVFYSSHEILSDEMKKHDSFFDDDPIYKTDKLLIIDDFGAEFSSKGDWTSAVWDKVINHRYANELPTILTTNLTYPEIISKYNERITDRLNECAKFVVVNEKSYRVRNQAVKESKQLRNLDPNELEILLNEK